MKQDMASGVSELIERLDRAVLLDGVPQITASIKDDLEQLVCRSSIALPEQFRQDAGGSYARRLLHRDPDLRYTVVVMTWGPGQGTQLHDHAGMWCVECVVQGGLLVTQYDLLEQTNGRFRFDRKAQLSAGVGEAGCLIPPYEYHVLGNAFDDRTSISLHVYGGEMDRCNLYVPQADAWWLKQARRLSYHD